ncbi:MAG: PEP-CTERM sorting domain-containing protein [Planctomycetes bacterium]|nr:PEP-CTERM sorting domain-containing protein [Planctomycetota bacterium]
MTKSHLRHLWVFFVMLSISGGGLLSTAMAADWIGGNGDFGDANQWGGTVPGPADDAIFDAGGFYDVIFNSDPTTLSLQVHDDVLFESGDPGNLSTYTLESGTTSVTLDNNSVLQVFDLNINAAGDMLILGGSNLAIGGGATFNVDDTLIDDGQLEVVGGSLLISPNDSLTIELNGTLVLDGGQISTGELFNNGGFFDFFGGTLDITGATGLTVGPTGALGSNPLVDVGQIINITETTTVEAGSTLTIDGGEFTTGVLELSGGAGTLDFVNGTLGITGQELEVGAGGVLGGGFTLGFGQTLNVSNQTRVPGGESLDIDGGDFTTDTLVFDGPGAGINLLSGTATFNNLFTRNGSVVVFGAGNNFVVPGEIIVGEDGTGSTLEIRDGATVESANGAIGDLLGAEGEVIVRGAGSTWTMTDNGAKFQIGNDGDGTLRVVQGGNVFANGANIGDETTSLGTLIVDGPGSLYGKSSDPSRNVDVGFRGIGILEITNGGGVEGIGTRIAADVDTFGDVLVQDPGSTLTNDGGTAVGANATGTGTLQVLDGGVVNDGGNSSIGVLGAATIDGTGSAWNIGGDLNMAASSLASLTIIDDGTVNVAGTLTIGSDGAGEDALVSLDGGTLNVGGLVPDGTFDWSSGSLGFTGPGGFTVGPGGDLGDNFTLDAGKSIDVANTTSVDAGSTLTIEGGDFNTDELSVSGTDALFVMQSGTASANRVSISNGGLVRLNGGEFTSAQPIIIGGGAGIELGGGTLNTPSVQLLAGGQLSGSGTLQGAFSGGAGSLIVVDSGSLSLGDAASFQGFGTGGSIRVESGATLILGSAGFARLGPLTTLNGGTLRADNGVALTQGSNLVGRGTVSGRFAAGAGSVIQATGNLTLGDANHFGGFVSSGELRTGANIVTIHDRNQAELGSVTTLGDGAGNPGVVVAANSVVVGFGRAIQGHGTVDTPNDAAKPLVNNGTIAGESAARPISLPGFVKGVGSFDNVEFDGTFSPGLSPAALSMGSVVYGENSTLQIELAGLQAGSQYDQLNHSGTVTLGGTLEVSLLNDFQPSAGDTFEIMNFASSTGQFSSFSGLDLGGGLRLDPQFDATSLTLVTIGGSVFGDLTSNGFVDFQDLTVLLANWNKMVAAGDGNLVDEDTSVVNFQDLTVLLAAWTGPGPAGAPEGALAGQAVPEPSAVILLILGALAGMPLLRRRSVARRRG